MAPSSSSSAASAEKEKPREAIYTKGGVWHKLIERVKIESKQTDTAQAASKPDAFLFIVGERGSGKTTLLNAFLHPGGSDKNRMAATKPKPTEGLDYTFARKSSSLANVERKDVANIWEVSGTESFKKEVAHSDNLFITPRQVATATVLIVVDLSRPWEVLNSLTGWLARVRVRLDEVYDKFNRRGSKIPSQLKARAKKAFGSKHEDDGKIDHTGVSVIIAANKYDTFCDEDAELRKIMARTLRYVAHTNGATLVYTSNKGGSNSKDSRNTLNNLRHVLNHYLFTGADRKLPSKGAVQNDHLQPLFMPGGADHLRDIGRPKAGGGGSQDDAREGIQEWKAVFQRFFTPQADEESENKPPQEEGNPNSQFREDEIDAMREQKLRELEEYRRQVQLEQHQSKRRSSTLSTTRRQSVSSGGGSKKASAVRRSSIF
ncbi:light intermediate chain of dynein [Chloropicon primus]|uniref:Cytoplasmic dynein 2 light intermediate chain 1 n=1 Tax=Chloropicon primus TaxID=1764295 RepID=A0A5B8MQF8_9CHLO|nr:light intermediate chain of dynein [Chloropicon primus]UPR01867.1 light intermediate chain of dynein [Chloropicon primus]|eukprot:QDZ22643.1 light intermediate chain of dynein [Chloropicon primus]